MVRMAFDDFNDDDFKGGGSGRPAPGKYHCVICDARETDKVELSFEVLNGTTDGQVGKVYTEKFAVANPADPKADKALRRRLFGVAVALGLITEEEVKASGGNVEINFFDAMNRQCVIVLKPEEYPSKRPEDNGRIIKTSKLEFNGVLSLDAKEAKNVPRDESALAMADYSTDGGGYNSETVGAGTAAGEEITADEF